MLQTKSILSPILDSDGSRISVMSRHTLNDGTTPHPLITRDTFSIHLPQLAPSPKLIGDYYRRSLPWEQFEARYLQEMRTKPASEFVRFLARVSLKTVVTLLCIEEAADHCHRRLLAEECKRLEPEIKITHL